MLGKRTYTDMLSTNETIHERNVKPKMSEPTKKEYIIHIYVDSINSREKFLKIIYTDEDENDKLYAKIIECEEHMKNRFPFSEIKKYINIPTK